MSAWQAIMDWLTSNLLVNLVATSFIWWALGEFSEIRERILDGSWFEEDDSWDEEGFHNVEEVLHEEYEEGGISDEVDQGEEVEVESEYEESVHDVEENGENGLREERENIRSGTDGNDFSSEEWSDCEDCENHSSEFHFSTAVSLPVAIVSPLTTVVDVRNVLAGALREATPELRVSAQETEQIMRRLHNVECHKYLREERELGLQEHKWSSCKLYLKHDLVNKYFLAVTERISLPRRA